MGVGAAKGERNGELGEVKLNRNRRLKDMVPKDLQEPRQDLTQLVMDVMTDDKQPKRKETTEKGNMSTRKERESKSVVVSVCVCEGVCV